MQKMDKSLLSQLKHVNIYFIQLNNQLIALPSPKMVERLLLLRKIYINDLEMIDLVLFGNLICKPKENLSLHLKSLKAKPY